MEGGKLLQSPNRHTYNYIFNLAIYPLQPLHLNQSGGGAGHKTIEAIVDNKIKTQADDKIAILIGQNKLSARTFFWSYLS